MNEYYGELCTRIYEIDKSIASGKELEFYLSFVKDKNMNVLEPMCGNGRMLIPFMEKGINIEGFDISDEMLRLCRKKGQKLDLEPKISQGKIEEFRSETNYDLILIPFGSFSLLPDELVKPSLYNMRSVLKEGGKILLTIMTRKGPVEEIPDWLETNRQSVDNHEIVEYKKVHYDMATRIQNTKLNYQLVINGQIEKSETMDFPIRLYEPGEFENILKSNRINKFVLHEVTNGYGEGNSFHVYECTL
ncbi:class I SAM-dependent methyltransferase [Sporosarcina sp. BI001-red]|uniref:class I SAM-dependent methyltransferase n=1 Tax=Sporosarcina sp. BI001-red TaxID=2282866 RepID=UPI000E26DD0F|nr:class I SAM-dependent methyltransferase [Sporosarcina sp. BI001-red]REB07316.1 class I SAM-dependent methyltransferase [Sporosarcina sp. BI001-red]